MNSICCNSDLPQSASVVSSDNRTQSLTNAESIQPAPVEAKFNFLQGPGDLLSRFGKYLVLKHNQRIDRMAFNSLLKLDDNLLKDIGVTRQDVIWASNLPLHEDASKKINEIARRK